MSEIRRYGISMDFAKCHIKENGEFVEFTDYESERLAHEETKKNSAITVQALLIEQEALGELQDAVYVYVESGSDYGQISNAIKASEKRIK
jgi:hypothetical protein